MCERGEGPTGMARTGEATSIGYSLQNSFNLGAKNLIRIAPTTTSPDFTGVPRTTRRPKNFHSLIPDSTGT